MLSISNATIQANATDHLGSVSSVNPESELVEIKSKNSLLPATNHTERSLAKDNESPTSLSSDETLFFDKSTSVKSKVSPDLKAKKEISSNVIHNDKKAVGHIVTLSLASLIGIVLAPFTGGISLLPTAFVVLFGNSSALAMYGGSQFFVDDTKDDKSVKNKSSDQPNDTEYLPIDEYVPPNTEGVQYPQPDNSDIDPSEESDREIPESVGSGFEHIVPDVIDEQESTEDRDNKPPTFLEDVIEKFGNTSVIECYEPEEAIDQSDFMSKFSQLPESENITNFLEQQPVVEQIAHLDNGMKVYIGRIAPHHVEAGKANNNSLIPPASLKPTLETMNASVKAKQWPKVEVPPAVKTTQGATSGRGDNHTAGVRKNSESLQSAKPTPVVKTSVGDKAKQWPKVEIPPAVKATQGGTSGRGDNHTAGVRKNSESLQSAKPTPVVKTSVGDKAKQWPEVEIPPAVKATQGGTSGRGDNHTAGVRENSESQQSSTPNLVVKTGGGDKAKQWPKVDIPPVIKATQGGTSGRGDNHTTGVRHNGKNSQSRAVDQAELYSVSGKRWPTVNVPDGVRTSQGPMSGRSDNYNSGVRKNTNIENPDVANRATEQGISAERSSPYTKGVVHNLLDVDALKRTALSYQDNFGIDKEVNLHFLHRSADKTKAVAVSEINLGKLVYSSD
ncbi:TPA: hypothetical protein ACQ301_004423 [Yersinia enterocolitica]